MPAAKRLPIRVLVKGASTVVLRSELGGSRTDFAFGRTIEAELLAAGRSAAVRVVAAPSELAKMSLRTWEREILSWAPDVVVLQYGFYESAHFFAPRWLERHANSTRARPGTVRDAYRKYMLRGIWISLARVQSRVDAKFPSTMFGHRLRRVAADLAQLTANIQTVGSPLVLVMEVTPPGRRWRSWMPGMPERIALMNDALALMVERFDAPNVRLFKVSEAVAHLLPEGAELTPDGGHYSSEVHRWIGEALAREILIWADEQPHLRPRDASSRIVE